MPASRDQREHAAVRAGNIYGLIKQAAERGESCPTNMALGTRFGCSAQVIVNAIAFLEANGMIAVECGNSRRVVKITATGQSTAGTVGKAHWSRRRAA